MTVGNIQNFFFFFNNQISMIYTNSYSRQTFKTLLIIKVRQCDKISQDSPTVMLQHLHLYFNGLPTFGFFFFIIVHIYMTYLCCVCVPSKYNIKVPVVRKYYLVLTPRFVYIRLEYYVISLWYEVAVIR